MQYQKEEETQKLSSHCLVRKPLTLFTITPVGEKLISYGGTFVGEV